MKMESEKKIWMMISLNIREINLIKKASISGGFFYLTLPLAKA
jgi:hypothetical protein